MLAPSFHLAQMSPSLNCSLFPQLTLASHHAYFSTQYSFPPKVLYIYMYNCLLLKALPEMMRECEQGLVHDCIPSAWKSAKHVEGTQMC